MAQARRNNVAGAGVANVSKTGLGALVHGTTSDGKLGDGPCTVRCVRPFQHTIPEASNQQGTETLTLRHLPGHHNSNPRLPRFAKSRSRLRTGMTSYNRRSDRAEPPVPIHPGPPAAFGKRRRAAGILGIRQVTKLLDLRFTMSVVPNGLNTEEGQHRTRTQVLLPYGGAFGLRLQPNIRRGMSPNAKLRTSNLKAQVSPRAAEAVSH